MSKNLIKCFLIEFKLYKYITAIYDEIIFNNNFIKNTINIAFLSKKHSLFFFFPHYCTGGAQKVHLDIVKLFKEIKPVVFITSDSENNQYLAEYKDNSVFFDLLPFIKRTTYNKFLSKIIIRKINSLKKATVFGSNSYFFYQLLSSLNTGKVKRIDLLHAFTLPNEPGAEKWSLSKLEYLDKRIVISEHLKNLLICQYKTNNVRNSEIEKIEVIYNRTEKPVDLVNRDFNDKLKIIYIGRNSEEKRVPLIFQIAEKLRNDKNIEFYFAGFEKTEVDQKYIELENCVFLGVINEKARLDEILNTMHILILISKREGFPLVISEAMSHGVVPLSTNVGAISEIIIDGKNGFLFNSNQHDDNIIESFSSKIAELNKDRDKLKQLSLQCIVDSKKKYVQSDFDKKYYELLK